MTIALETRSAGDRSSALRARQRRRRLTVLAFLTPWILGVLIFFVYPLIDTVYLSFTRYDLLSPPQWVGLRNYEFAFTKDPQVRKAAWNTLWLVVILVPARMLFGALFPALRRLDRVEAIRADGAAGAG